MHGCQQFACLIVAALRLPQTGEALRRVELPEDRLLPARTSKGFLEAALRFVALPRTNQQQDLSARTLRFGFPPALSSTSELRHRLIGKLERTLESPGACVRFGQAPPIRRSGRASPTA
jgi:hypothetical protein